MMFQELWGAMKAHAEAEYPNEACGLVVDGAFVPCGNRAEDPATGFLIDRYPLQGLQAVFHSHPDGPEYPSEADMRQQMATAVPWAISPVYANGAKDPFWFGDGTPTPPLKGRVFRHGVTDCYALLRDYYKLEKGVVLPEFPRAMDWWYQGGNLLSDNFAKAGFQRIDLMSVEPGDVVLASVLCPGVTNHSGVYTGNGLILHHMFNRVSREEPLGPWMKYVTHALRHSG